MKNRYQCKNSCLRCSILTLVDAFKAAWYNSHMPACTTHLKACCHLETKSKIFKGSPESHLTLYPILVCLVIKDSVQCWVKETLLRIYRHNSNYYTLLQKAMLSVETAQTQNIKLMLV